MYLWIDEGIHWKRHHSSAMAKCGITEIHSNSDENAWDIAFEICLWNFTFALLLTLVTETVVHIGWLTFGFVHLALHDQLKNISPDVFRCLYHNGIEDNHPTRCFSIKQLNTRYLSSFSANPKRSSTFHSIQNAIECLSRTLICPWLKQLQQRINSSASVSVAMECSHVKFVLQVLRAY